MLKPNIEKKSPIGTIFKFIISFSILLVFFSISANSAFAKDDKAKTLQSIKADLMNPVFDVTLSNGTIIDDGGETKGREKINTEILNDKGKKRYSLYDRFGGNIKFVPYFGESKISTNLMDKFYTYFKDNDAKFTVNADEIIKLIRNPKTTTNNIMYVGRADVLTSEDVKKGGKKDPRVAAWSPSNSAGISAGIGNANLTISEFLTYLTAWLSGTGLFETVYNIWKAIWDSQIGKLVDEIFKKIFPILGIILILGVVQRTVKFAKGKGSYRNIMIYAFTGVAMASIMTSFAANPNVFLDDSKIVVTSTDEVFDKGLSLSGSPIVKSDVTSNVRMASLWEKTVFGPWVEGSFGAPYNKMYSNFAKGKDHSGMNLSHDKLDGKWGDKVRFNASQALGDPVVPLGNKVNEQNWAALAWSTQSIYHISKYSNKGLETKGLTDKGNAKTAWPIAPVTPMNNQIYLDSFRWIDAKLNVSNGYVGKMSSDNIITDYTSSREYKQSFVAQGMKSLFLTLLLFPILIQGYKKTKQSVLVIAGGVGFLVNTGKWFINPDGGYGLMANFKKLIGSIGWYMWISMIIYMQITCYRLLANNILGIALWIVIGLYLSKVVPPKSFEDLKNKARNIKKNIVNSDRYKDITDGVKSSALAGKLARDEVRDERKRNKKNGIEDNTTIKDRHKQAKDLKTKLLRYENGAKNKKNNFKD